MRFRVQIYDDKLRSSRIRRSADFFPDSRHGYYTVFPDIFAAGFRLLHRSSSSGMLPAGNCGGREHGDHHGIFL